MVHSNSAFIAVVSSVVLASCGGGGSNSTPASTQFSGFSNIPENGTTEFDGTARTGDFSEAPSGFYKVVTEGFTRSGDANASLVTADGEAVALSIDAPGSSVSVDTRAGGTANPSSALSTAFLSQDGQVINIVDPDLAGFEHQTFGYWVTGMGSSSGTVGVGSFGSKTPSRTELPVTATYNGGSIGVAIDIDGTPYATDSFVEVSTDFSTASISSTGSTITDLTTGDVISVPGIDFSGSGPVDGTGFDAVVTGGLGLSGDADGQFYGPGAEEVGGTFSLDSADGIHYGGAYGAKR